MVFTFLLKTFIKKTCKEMTTYESMPIACCHFALFFNEIPTTLNMQKPIMLPRILAIISSISVARPMKYCVHSIVNVNRKVMLIKLCGFRVCLNTVGKKKPNGTKSIMLGMISNNTRCSIFRSCNHAKGIRFSL